MYVPAHFDQPDVAVMHELIRARPLATLVTLGAGGLDANHIPLHLVEAPLPLGTLRGHVARANLVWRDAADGVAALAIFHGPDAYISPSWYATKTETGRVVPTWNYAVVHAHGYLRVIDDRSWLRAQIDALTTRHEAPLPAPWAIADAPPAFIEELIAAIVGVEIVITTLSGKWKLSQNQPARNRAGIIAGLLQSADPGAASIAALMEAGADET